MDGRLTVLPENILRRMEPDERRKLGKAGRTVAECQDIVAGKLEKDLQHQIRATLERRNIFYIWSRTDKKTTTQKGNPDFMIILPGAKALAVEAKIKTGRISDDQRTRFEEYFYKTGQTVHVVFNLADFNVLLNGFIG